MEQIDQTYPQEASEPVDDYEGILYTRTDIHYVGVRHLEALSEINSTEEINLLRKALINRMSTDENTYRKAYTPQHLQNLAQRVLQNVAVSICNTAFSDEQLAKLGLDRKTYNAKKLMWIDALKDDTIPTNNDNLAIVEPKDNIL